jgi:hypothetical protein
MNRMDPNIAQTEFVRRMLVERPVEPDATYAQDLLALERFLSTKAVGMAESIALSHLVSRYPREADAIVRELGVRSFIPFEDERVAALVDERLRLALGRTRLPRLRSDEPVDLLEL